MRRIASPFALLALAGSLAAAVLVPVAPALATAGTDPAAAPVDREIGTPLVRESSGLARSTFDRRVLWTHNDEGDGARLYAIGGAGRLRAVLDVQGATNVDWEDVAAGPDHTLWVGDVGDTTWTRPTISVYRVTEPKHLANGSVTATRYELAYPDGARNAGAIMVDPNGRLYVVSKVRDGGAIYRAPATLSTTSVNQLTKVADAPGEISAASFAPDGRRFVLAAPGTAYFYDSLGGTPVEAATPALPYEDSAEISRDGSRLYVGSEGADSAVYSVAVPGARTTTTATAAATTRTSTTSTIETANWDALATGQVTAAEFISQLPSPNKTETIYDDSSIAADTRGSGKVYRLTLKAGTMHRYPSGNNGIVTFIPLSKQVDNACLSYDVRFSSGFDWSLGGKLPGLEGVRAGISPATPTGGGNPGDQGWSGRIMWLGPKAYSWAGPTDEAVSYMYGPKQTEYYGDNYRWHKPFVAGQWHKVKVCYTMNTVGSANGMLRAWMDGAQVLDVTNFVYRTRNDVHISHLNWSIFRGGATKTWAGSRDGYVDFDNVLITTTS